MKFLVDVELCQQQKAGDLHGCISEIEIQQTDEQKAIVKQMKEEEEKSSESERIEKEKRI